MPRPEGHRTLKTLMVRVPAGEWQDVKQGRKREFRTTQKPFGNGLGWPQPVVGWRWTKQYGVATTMLIVENTWVEPLGAISQESLRMEGCETLADYRRRWCIQNGRRFPPGKEMMVVRFRLLTDTERPDMANRLLEHLYGPWLEA